MGCDYLESKTLHYEYTFRDQFFSSKITYSTQRCYIYPSDGENYYQCLARALEHKKEIDVTNNDCYINYVLSDVYLKHNFLYPNEKFMSPFNSITDEEIKNFVKVNRMLYGSYLSINNVKNKIQQNNDILLRELNQKTDIKIVKIICKISRIKSN